MTPIIPYNLVEELLGGDRSVDDYVWWYPAISRGECRLGPSNMWLVHAVCDHMQSSIWALSQNESPLHLFHAYAVLDRVDQINLPDTALIAD